MKNKILAITRDSIPYVKELRNIPEVKSCAAAILMQQLDYWFSKSKKDRFFKFLSPCDHPKYSEGDSWTEELGFSEDEFRTAFDCLGVRYKSMKEVSEVQKNGQDVFQNMFYLSYTNRIEACTYYVRNNDLVDCILDNLIAGTLESLYETKITQIGKAKIRKQVRPSYVNGGSQVTEIGNTNTDSIITENTSENTSEKEPLTPFSNGKNKPKNKCEPQPIPAGLDTPDFVEAWAQLLETKKWRTKEASAINLALKKLSAYDVAFAIQLVETATMGGYQGVVFSDTPTAYEKWQKTKQTSLQTFQQPHPNFPNRPLYINLFADKWAKVKWWRTNLAELENGQDKEFSFTEISKMLQYTEPLNILK